MVGVFAGNITSLFWLRMGSQLAGRLAGVSHGEETRNGEKFFEVAWNCETFRDEGCRMLDGACFTGKVVSAPLPFPTYTSLTPNFTAGVFLRFVCAKVSLTTHVLYGARSYCKSRYDASKHGRRLRPLETKPLSRSHSCRRMNSLPEEKKQILD